MILGFLFQQSPNPVELHLGGGMKPAEASHAGVALGQDMLEKAADQFGGSQRQGSALT
jgi:hypothetical protein